MADEPEEQKPAEPQRAQPSMPAGRAPRRSSPSAEAQLRLAQALAERRARQEAQQKQHEQQQQLLRLGSRYDPAPRREETRSRIALFLLFLLAAVSLLLVVFTGAGTLEIADARDIAGVVLAPLVVLTGTVFGFYFSGHSDK